MDVFVDCEESLFFVNTTTENGGIGARVDGGSGIELSEAPFMVIDRYLHVFATDSCFTSTVRTRN